MKVVVGSASAIKLAALQKVYPDASVSGVEVVSAVPPQPVGRPQTEEGARHRAVEAHKAKPDADLWVGIENGMYQVEHEGQLKWVDAACIVVICKKEGGNVESVVWSDEIDIPADFPKGPEGEWSVLKDPHNEITQGKRPRASFISDALLAWKNEEA